MLCKGRDHWGAFPMKADSLKMSKVFASGGDVHYVLPHFQREYSWERENWQTLFLDVQGVYEAYCAENEPEHFMGSLVVINDGTRNGVIPAFKLVDGQQRLTTISLLLCALERLIKDKHPDIAKKIQRLLTNPDEAGVVHYKLLPTTKYGDRETYFAIIDGNTPPSTGSKIAEAFDYLYGQLSYKIEEGQIDPTTYFVALANCLHVVFIDLDQHERPFEIFESLNAKAKPLSPADLVRNYIAMRLPEASQEGVFNQYWAKIDDMLLEKRTVGKSRLGELTAFLRHYLAMISGTLPNERHVYERFRDRMEAEFKSTDAFIGELATLKRFAEYYNRLLRPEQETDHAIRQQLNRLNILEISTAYPFLLAMYDAFEQKRLQAYEFLDALQVIENYLVRRYLADEPTNYLNKMFPTLWNAIDRTRFGASLRQILLTKNYPADNRIREVLYTQSMYEKAPQGRQKTVLVLETINRHLSKGSGGFTVLDASSTIEHIMPQKLSEDWKKHLGERWEELYRDHLDTLGNLTLVTQDWNAQLSNEAFGQKKEKLARHALRINCDYFSRSIKKWNDGAIRERADFLCDQIFQIWTAIGEPMVKHSATGIKPKAVLILGDTYPVKSWRDVACQTAEVVAKISDDFDRVVSQVPGYFFQEKNQYAPRQLSNGWWIYLNLSASGIKSLCRNLIAAAGIPEEDWQVEEE
jgi:uncharacterized protein with ParB-like and HNH nuclease domain